MSGAIESECVCMGMWARESQRETERVRERQRTIERFGEKIGGRKAHCTLVHTSPEPSSCHSTANAAALSPHHIDIHLESLLIKLQVTPSTPHACTSRVHITALQLSPPSDASIQTGDGHPTTPLRGNVFSTARQTHSALQNKERHWMDFTTHMDHYEPLEN